MTDKKITCFMEKYFTLLVLDQDHQDNPNDEDVYIFEYLK